MTDPLPPFLSLFSSSFPLSPPPAIYHPVLLPFPHFLSSPVEIDLPLHPRSPVITALSDRPAMIAQGKWDSGGTAQNDGEEHLISNGEIRQYLVSFWGLIAVGENSISAT